MGSLNVFGEIFNDKSGIKTAQRLNLLQNNGTQRYHEEITILRFNHKNDVY